MSVNDYWWTALGLGAVVLVAALALLTMLLEQVRRIEQAATTVLDVAGQVATATQATSLLVATSGRLDALSDEAARHAALLTDAAAGR